MSRGTWWDEEYCQEQCPQLRYYIKSKTKINVLPAQCTHFQGQADKD